MDVVPLHAEIRARLQAHVEAMTDDALRTFSVAYRPLDAGEKAHGDESLERGLIFVGTVGIIDPARAEAAVAVREAHRAGIACSSASCASFSGAV